MKKKAIRIVALLMLKIWGRHLRNPSFKYDGMTKMETLVSDWQFSRWTCNMIEVYAFIHSNKNRRVAV